MQNYSMNIEMGCERKSTKERRITIVYQRLPQTTGNLFIYLENFIETPQLCRQMSHGRRRLKSLHMPGVVHHQYGRGVQKVHVCISCCANENHVHVLYIFSFLNVCTSRCSSERAYVLPRSALPISERPRTSCLLRRRK